MRLFVAIDVPTTIKTSIERATSPLKRSVEGSWVKSESLHLTLAFIGEQPAEQVPVMAASLHDALATYEAFACNVVGAGVFPSAKRARVGWLGLAPDTPLQSVAERVRVGLHAANVIFDAKAFKPHLTIVRFRQTPRVDALKHFLESLQKFDSEPFTVDHVTLYSSVLSPGGAVHTPQAKFALA